MKQPEEDNYIASITEDVMAVLKKKRFFERLDDLLSPVDHRVEAVRCNGDYAQTFRILSDLRFEEEDQADVIDVLESRGGCCDCEILYNASEENRLKANHWRSRAAEVPESPSHGGQANKRRLS